MLSSTPPRQIRIDGIGFGRNPFTAGTSKTPKKNQYRISANLQFGNVVFKSELLRTTILMRQHCPDRESPSPARTTHVAVGCVFTISGQPLTPRLRRCEGFAAGCPRRWAVGFGGTRPRWLEWRSGVSGGSRRRRPPGARAIWPHSGCRCRTLRAARSSGEASVEALRFSHQGLCEDMGDRRP